MFYWLGTSRAHDLLHDETTMSWSSPMMTDEQKTHAVALLVLTVSLILLVA